MSNLITVPRLEVAENDMLCLSQVERLSLIAATLADASLSPESLIYCGIDGTKLKRARTWPVRGGTWGVTFREFQTAADLYDRLGKADHDPLRYALDQMGLPALITYHAEQVKEVPNKPEQYIPQEGSNMNKAAAALIFIF